MNITTEDYHDADSIIDKIYFIDTRGEKVTKDISSNIKLQSSKNNAFDFDMEIKSNNPSSSIRGIAFKVSGDKRVAIKKLKLIFPY